jgi:hypothetical protein
MSVALHRSISGKCNAHKHARSRAFCIVITVFDQTTAVISGCYVFRFITEILIAGEYDFLHGRAQNARGSQV